MLNETRELYFFLCKNGFGNNLFSLASLPLGSLPLASLPLASGLLVTAPPFIVVTFCAEAVPVVVVTVALCDAEDPYCEYALAFAVTLPELDSVLLPLPLPFPDPSV